MIYAFVNLALIVIRTKESNRETRDAIKTEHKAPQQKIPEQQASDGQGPDGQSPDQQGPRYPIVLPIVGFACCVTMVALNVISTWF